MLGVPLRLVNLPNAKRNMSALRSGVNSKCTALFAAQVKRHVHISFNLFTYLFSIPHIGGSAKSTPEFTNGGPSLTLGGLAGAVWDMFFLLLGGKLHIF